MKNVQKSLFGALSAAVLVMGLAGAPAMAQDSKPADTTPAKQEKQHKDKEHKKDKSEAKMVAPGDTAPDFKLKDTEGKDVSLADLTKQGKTVVLVWFNPDCPFVKQHFENGANTFIALNNKYKDKNVVVLGINSGAKGKEGSGVERNQKAIKDWKINFPILMDESGTVGHAYNAKNTPLTVVIGKDGKVAFYGAPDDGADGKGPGKNSYVSKALDEVLAGKPVTKATEKPYGCGVKY